jgi:hypothetical protein
LNITADTNVLVRALVADEPAQAAEASRVLREATSIAVSLPVLCELVWVWQRLIGFVMAVWLGDSCLACSCSGGSWPGPAGGTARQPGSTARSRAE